MMNSKNNRKVKEFDFTRRDTDLLQTFKELLSEGYFNEIFEKYRDPATRYAFKVLTLKQVASYKIQLACFRHLNDLKRSICDHDFPFEYDLNDCHLILNFAKLCPDVSVNKPVPLMLWQQAILCLNQGWRTKKNNQKRFTYALISVARTNGKTYLTNILLAYSFLIENAEEYNQDYLYSAPVDKQSIKGWRYIRQTFQQLSNTPGFKKLIKNQRIEVNDETVKNRKTFSNLQRLTANSGQFDAYHFLLAIVDEYGDPHYANGAMGKITSGQVQKVNHETLAISTAYDNPNCPMFRDEKRLTEVLEKDNSREEDRSLLMVWEQDDIAETDRPETWVKSNPLLDLPSMRETLLNGLLDEKAHRSSSGDIYKFQNRNLNMWLATSANKYLRLDDIQQSVVSDFNIESRDCYVGFDLSRFNDDTAVAFVFPYTDDKDQRFFIYQHSFVPTAHSQKSIVLKSQQDGIDYEAAEIQGFATISKNRFGEIDNEIVGQWYLDFVKEHNLNIKAFIYDAHLAAPLIEWLSQQCPDVPFVTLRQGTLSLDPPTRELRKMFEMRRISMLDDPIMQYSLINASLFENAYGVKVDKESRSAKIDVVDAIIDAISEAQYWFTNPERNEIDSKQPFAGWSQEKIDDYYKNDFSF